MQANLQFHGCKYTGWYNFYQLSYGMTHTYLLYLSFLNRKAFNLQRGKNWFFLSGFCLLHRLFEIFNYKIISECSVNSFWVHVYIFTTQCKDLLGLRISAWTTYGDILATRWCIFNENVNFSSITSQFWNFWKSKILELKFSNFRSAKKFSVRRRKRVLK